MTSELSDALNPYAAQHRTRNNNEYNQFLNPPQPVVQQPRPYVPHRSELELAIAEPPSPRPPPQPRPLPRSDGINVNAVQELFRVIAASKEANEQERKRRIAWEQEQEAKQTQREAELERQLAEMRQELASLKAYVVVLPALLRSSNSGAPILPQIQAVPTPAPPYIQPVSPISQSSYSQATPAQAHALVNHSSSAVPATHPLSPISQPPSRPLPLFVEGSSTRPLGDDYNPDFHQDARDTITESSPSVFSSPQFQRAEPPLRGELSTEAEISSIVPRRRRRMSLNQPTDGDDEGSYGDSGDERSERPLKRLNHHDTRILTIQHAMRLQILRSMRLENDQRLPDNHIEGAPLGPDEAVRFVWLKTVRQSEHNANMRKRVLEELKANRKTTYKYVPESDFNDKTLEAVFEQAFTTFRHKFKAQKDVTIAQKHKSKESNKAVKVRRHSRKKLKLTNRVDARKRINGFAHETFDGAFQVECMSSEDSMDEEIRFGAPRMQDKGQVLRIRGLLWRSSRLQRLFGLLDEDDQADKSLKPKRGIGRKERCIGPPRDGMPPKGVARWMISRRWLRTMELSQPQFSQIIQDIIVDHPDFDWEHFYALGDESDDEYGPQDYGLQQTQYVPIPYQDTSYSLQYALAPVS
ncbi:hypothetical protein NEOLEDRAFT_982239 [Neolentinus lepideus HHB14362 ss-1]|uniref:Uncharacterized protein n=1 Tax=Neolentinus lepideus HHB14362 ss-1 TaxID=1314782 RepID=A0A165N7M6_9AGAM|nr:hypothetical protein NEOLEDRAFT_982239 [Neolentinus lepideus HHB14362 ss-1]